MIERLTKDITVGEKFKGKVVRTTDFGAFVELAPGRDGMVHISELATTASAASKMSSRLAMRSKSS